MTSRLTAPTRFYAPTLTQELQTIYEADQQCTILLSIDAESAFVTLDDTYLAMMSEELLDGHPSSIKALDNQNQAYLYGNFPNFPVKFSLMAGQKLHAAVRGGFAKAFMVVSFFEVKS
jgi:hypothetical protein